MLKRDKIVFFSFHFYPKFKSVILIMPEVIYSITGNNIALLF